MSSSEGVAATLVKQLGAIDHTIVALSARGAKLLAEDKTIDKQRVCALGALLAELYFLGDAWRRLRDEVVAQHARPISQDACMTSSVAAKPAVLEECDSLLSALNVHLEQLSSNAALELQAAALDCREHVLQIAATKDVDEIYQQLSTFRGGSCFGLSANLLFESTPWFMTPHPGFSTTHAEGTVQSNPAVSSPRAPQDPTAADVASWLDIILSRELSRDPDEYYQEQINLKTFRSRHPEFSTAAAKWPLYAEKFWPTLKPQLSFLFQPPGPYNMVQWALEYARVTFPETFGDGAPSQDALLDLTDALCVGSFTPLHLAAALGLPTLCRAVLSMNEDNETGARHDKYRRGGPFGTPIYCALVGPEVLKCGMKALSWASILHEHDNPQTRAATVSVFLDANHPCGDGIIFDNGEQASFVGLAFWVALLSKDEAILDRVLDAGATVDESMQSFLQYEPLIDFLQSGSADLSFFVRLLVVIFDEVLVDIEGGVVGTTLGDVNVLGAIEDVMTDLKLDFSMLGEKKKVEWPDHYFHRLVYSYIRLEAFPQGLQRLVQDPRFNPSQRVLEDPDSTGTLLHMAVSNEMPDVVDILARAGADLTAVDEEGRTPLMCVESTPMLAKLINDHGDTTTATDYHGRNIWHYAAASNDVLLLGWLCEHDPWKEQNLKATTTAGCTPAAEAFLYIDEVATMTKENDLSEPLTARIILRQCRDITYLESSRSLAHVAAAWGRPDLLEALAGAGADFHEIDRNGRTAMHHLNAYASQEVVMRFQQLCRGLPIATDHGLTPAETMLKNFTSILLRNPGSRFQAATYPGGSRVQRFSRSRTVGSFLRCYPLIWRCFAVSLLPTKVNHFRHLHLGLQGHAE
jgi:hypothetical protein